MARTRPLGKGAGALGAALAACALVPAWAHAQPAPAAEPVVLRPAGRDVVFRVGLGAQWAWIPDLDMPEDVYGPNPCGADEFCFFGPEWEGQLHLRGLPAGGHLEVEASISLSRKLRLRVGAAFEPGVLEFRLVQNGLGVDPTHIPVHQSWPVLAGSFALGLDLRPGSGAFFGPGLRGTLGAVRNDGGEYLWAGYRQRSTDLVGGVTAELRVGGFLGRGDRAELYIAPELGVGFSEHYTTVSFGLRASVLIAFARL